MARFFVDYSIERNYDGDKVDTWTVYMRRDEQSALEICTCLDEVKAKTIAMALERQQLGVVFDILE